jgi:hypothetical protein
MEWGGMVFFYMHSY